VVPPASARGIFPNVLALPGDHSSIIRSTSADDDAYLALVRELREAVARGNALNVRSADAQVAASVTTSEQRRAQSDEGSYVPREVPRPTPLIRGRDSELQAASELLAQAQLRQSSPLVLISGLSGSGKTCLVRHVAARVLDAFPGGQLYFDLLNAPAAAGSVAAAARSFPRLSRNSTGACTPIRSRQGLAVSIPPRRAEHASGPGECRGLGDD
jgi:hypothetical protein